MEGGVRSRWGSRRQWEWGQGMGGGGHGCGSCRCAAAWMRSEAHPALLAALMPKHATWPGQWAQANQLQALGGRAGAACWGRRARRRNNMRRGCRSSSVGRGHVHALTLGPRVTDTASATLLMPSCSLRRASVSNTISLASARTTCNHSGKRSQKRLINSAHHAYWAAGWSCAAECGCHRAGKFYSLLALYPPGECA